MLCLLLINFIEVKKIDCLVIRDCIAGVHLKKYVLTFVLEKAWCGKIKSIPRNNI
jgi:hypothetical protein